MVDKVTQEVIPPITDPLGRYWNQPSLDKIALTEKYATMSKATFEELADYSFSRPSGVYAGKMWKFQSHESYEVKEGPKKGKYRKGPSFGKWMLAWYGNHDLPNFCSNHQREIVISENL